MTFEEAQNLVARWAPPKYLAKYKRMSEPHQRKVCSMLERMVPGRVLDIGAGFGTMACWLAARGWEVTATDRLPLGAAMTPELCGAMHIKYVQQNILHGGIDHKFDLVLMLQVLQHLKYRHDVVIKQVAAMTDAAGSCIVTVDKSEVHPPDNFAYQRWQDLPEVGEPATSMKRVVRYNAHSFQEMLSEAFEKVQVQTLESRCPVLIAECEKPLTRM